MLRFMHSKLGHDGRHLGFQTKMFFIVIIAIWRFIPNIQKIYSLFFNEEMNVCSRDNFVIKTSGWESTHNILFAIPLHWNVRERALHRWAHCLCVKQDKIEYTSYSKAILTKNLACPHSLFKENLCLSLKFDRKFPVNGNGRQSRIFLFAMNTWPEWKGWMIFRNKFYKTNNMQVLLDIVTYCNKMILNFC